MAATSGFTLRKEERISSRNLIEQLFNGGNSRSLSAYPLRVVYMPTAMAAEPASILVSVPKRYFKRAVMRNRIKRQVREGYRKNKAMIAQKVSDLPEHGVAIAFIWMDNKLLDTSEVEKRVVNLLARIAERL